MAHTLCVGVTQSGKTTLARLISRGLLSNKKRVIVFDPLGTGTAGGGWGAGAEIFDDKGKFLDLMHDPAFYDAHIFVDESHHIFSLDQRENLWMLTQGRHYGMNFFLLTQRPTKIAPDARHNCGSCYTFRLAVDDARAIGADYGHSDIHKISLDRGDFLLLNSGSAKFSRANVFNLI